MELRARCKNESSLWSILRCRLDPGRGSRDPGPRIRDPRPQAQGPRAQGPRGPGPRVYMWSGGSSPGTSCQGRVKRVRPVNTRSARPCSSRHNWVQVKKVAPRAGRCGASATPPIVWRPLMARRSKRSFRTAARRPFTWRPRARSSCAHCRDHAWPGGTWSWFVGPSRRASEPRIRNSGAGPRGPDRGPQRGTQPGLAAQISGLGCPVPGLDPREPYGPVPWRRVLGFGRKPKPGKVNLEFDRAAYQRNM